MEKSALAGQGGNFLADSAFIQYVDVRMDADQLAEIIGRAKQHDPDAFDALVDAYSTRLYGYFYRLSGSRHDAEDLLQELFVRLVRMMADYEHDGRFEAWLFRIASNLVRDRLRQKKRAVAAGLGHPPGTGRQDSNPLTGIPDTRTEEPEYALHRAEQIDRMQKALERLPEAEREVMMMRHFSEMSFRDIAEVMNTPLGTALARAHRGLARLRKYMEGETQEP